MKGWSTDHRHRHVHWETWSTVKPDTDLKSALHESEDIYIDELPEVVRVADPEKGVNIPAGKKTLRRWRISRSRQPNGPNIALEIRQLPQLSRTSRGTSIGADGNVQDVYVCRTAFSKHSRYDEIRFALSSGTRKWLTEGRRCHRFSRRQIFLRSALLDDAFSRHFGGDGSAARVLREARVTSAAFAVGEFRRVSLNLRLYTVRTEELKLRFAVWYRETPTSQCDKDEVLHKRTGKDSLRLAGTVEVSTLLRERERGKSDAHVL